MQSAASSARSAGAETSDTGQARDQHTQALAIARDIGMPSEEALALEGLGSAHLHGANPSQSRPAHAAGTEHLSAHRSPRHAARPANPR